MATTPGLQKIRSTDEHSSRVQDNVATAFGPTAQALSRTPIMGVAPVWIQPTLLNGYQNFNAPGGTFAQAGYYVDSLSRLWCKGTLLNQSGGILTPSTAILRFPSGARPNEQQRLTVCGDGFAYQFVSVTPDGNAFPGVNVAAGGSLDIFFSYLAAQ